MSLAHSWIDHPILNLPAQEVLFACNKMLAEHDFAEFCRQAWPHVEPGRPLVWGWHLQAKCDHLQAVFNHTAPSKLKTMDSSVGIQNLIINEPPRCSKSLFSSVLFPAWVWAKWPGARFLCITYADDLAQRDALKCRQLIESSWYQSYWPKVRVSEDQRAKSRYNIDGTGGFRVSTTILGIATGEGGDFRIIDDPHNVKKSLSDVERQQANLFVDLTLPTRVVDPARTSTIICMQRLHQDDVTGHLLGNGDSRWDLLCLPMEYEGENCCSTALDFVDPRSAQGELLHPERWPREAVEKVKQELRMTLGDFGVNSQLQQRPTPLGGGMFKTANLIMVQDWPPIADLERIVRYWDKAGTQDSGCYTSGSLMARRKSNQRTIILDIHRGQWGPEQREDEIRRTAHMDLQKLSQRNRSAGYAIRLEQEPGSGGKDSALYSIKGLAGFDVKAVPKSVSKEVEWAPLASQVNAGGVEMVVGPWNQHALHEMASAPFGKYKDDLDSMSGAFKYIWLAKQTWIV